jgi:hypothetical protein
VGQVIDTKARGATPTSVVATLLDSSSNEIGSVPVSLAPGQSTGLSPFVGGIAIPAGTMGASLHVASTLDVDGGTHTVGRTEPIASSKPIALASPVRGTWAWTNGQGESSYHTHFQFPEQRYAYDLVIEKDVGGSTQAYEGDPTKNESYFCFGAPIHAPRAGTVVRVVDDVPDNFGTVSNPANTEQRNSSIVIEHEGGVFTISSHIRQGSAKVAEGQHVNAGDVLAEVGNAGFSSEPHLHFAAFVLDATGRVRAGPLSVTGLTSASGAAVMGVPRGSAKYTSP